MARRLHNQEVRVMLDQPTYRALCERAKRSNTSMSTVLRRALVKAWPPPRQTPRRR
ncbi:MAG: ribbon-helix-helix domain-containing protein [Sulfobacillus sp.]